MNVIRLYQFSVFGKSLVNHPHVTTTLSLVRFQHGSASTSATEPTLINRRTNDQLERPVVVDPENCYDIVINGGGIVGFSFLAALKSLPFLSCKRILLIEQQNEPKFSPALFENDASPRKFSNRVSALTAASRQLFEQIQIWPNISQYAKQVSGMYVWSEHYQNGINFRPSNYVDDSVCYIMENNRMIKALYDRISENSLENENIKVAHGTVVNDIEQRLLDGTNPQIVLKVNNKQNEQEHKHIQTKLLIGCDGFNSFVRQKSTLPYFEHNLDQMGIVGTLEVESPYQDNQVAFQRFVNSNGLVIALLPLDANHSSLVLSVPKRDANSWIQMDETDFIHRLNQEIIKESRSNPLDRLASAMNLNQLAGTSLVQSKIPPIITSLVPDSKAAFPLGFGTTVPFLVGSIQGKVPLIRAIIERENLVNTAIIGDAAHRIHPLAGQGLNLGLGDAHTLAQCLEERLGSGFDLFGSTVDSRESLSQALFDFERCRVLKLVPMLGAIHTMQTAFNYTPSALLSLLDSANWVKSEMVNFANSR